MTPREADKIIKAGKPVTVTTNLDHKPSEVMLVSRDRWNVRTADGGVFDRGEMKLVRCDGCNKSARLKDGLCALCTIEANLVHDCPGEAVPSFKLEAKDAKARIHATKTASPRVKEYYETAEIAAVIAQRVADRAKMLDIPEPQYRHITAIKNAMRRLREAENQLRLAGMPGEQWE